MGDAQASVDVDSQELEKVGRHLIDAPSSKDSLCKLLKHALLLLSSVSQSPHEATISAMQPAVEALVKSSLLKHKDKDVRLLVATCISEVMRIVAPEAPYDDEILRDVFELIVASFKGLNEISGPHYERRVSILESVATYRSCIVMLDLDCEPLIQEMFQTFFMTVSENSKSVMECMKTILCLVLNESEEISEQLLELILGNLLRDVPRTGYRLAKAVLKDCSETLRPYIEAFFNSSTSNEKLSTSRWSESIGDLIYEIYTCAPSLLPTIPKLTDELLTDDLEVRLKAVTLLGRMFASRQGVSDLFEGIYVEYMKRFTDKAVEVRLAMVMCAKQCFLSNVYGSKASDFLSALSDRLQDYDTRVRLQAVFAICDVAQSNPHLALVNELKRVADRLRDKEVNVRQETQQRLMSLFKLFCSNMAEGIPVQRDTFYWIPSKLIKSGCDKDSEEFRTQGMELVSEQLFPVGFPTKEIVKCWIDFSDAFDDNDRKAFHYILHQKQRLHSDMKNILLFREKLQGDEIPEAEARMLALCKSLSNVFVNSAQTETQLHKFTQLKDSKLFKDLSDLLDPGTPMSQSSVIRTNLLKRLGEKHPLYGLLNVLSLKCSYALFGKEHMRVLLAELKELTSLEDERSLKASMALLVDFTNHFPVLLDGMEDELMYLLNQDIDFVKDGAVQALAKVGGSMRGRIPEESRSVNVLEDLCIMGSRKQAKYAVQALAAMSNDSGLTVFSGLYRKLLDLLESSIKLPTILQSLGCIAQHAISVFEAHEEDIVNFIVKDLFKTQCAPVDADDDEQCSLSEITQLKIFGIKALVRSFLPNKDSQQVQRLKGLLKILSKFVDSGEISNDIESSGTDKAHLRVAAAVGILRLSKRYDAQITPELFEATVSCAKDCPLFLRRQFLSKVEKLLKERHIPLKYICTFPLTIGVFDSDFLQEVKQQLSDIIQIARRHVRHKDPVHIGQLDTISSEFYPEFVLFHFVHVLANQSDCDEPQSSESMELLVKQLYVFLWALLNQSVEILRKNDERPEVGNTVSTVYGIFSKLKSAEDMVDSSKTTNTYIICDIGLAILKKLLGIEHFDMKDIPNFPLPKMIYASSEETVEMEEQIEGSYLPSSILDDLFFLQILPCGKDVETNTQKKTDAEEINFVEKEEIPTNKQTEVVASPRKKQKVVQSLKLDTKPSDHNGQQGVKLLSELSDADEKSRASYQVNGYQEKAADTTKPKKLNLKAISPKKKRTTFNDDETAQQPQRLSGTATKKQKAPQSEKLDERSSIYGDDKNVTEDQATEQMGIQHEKALNMEGALNSKKIDVRILSPEQKPHVSKEIEDETLLSAMQKQKRVKSIVEIDAGLDASKTSSPQMGINDKEETPLDSPWKRIRISIKEPKAPQPEPVDGDIVGAKKHHERKVPNLMVDKDMGVHGRDLLNKKVLVYWPLDKRFYQGTISAYDAIKNLHDVSYDDGDKETLDLRKERWKLVEEKDSDREDSILASKISKFHLQPKAKKHSLANEKTPDDKSNSRSHKKAKSDANNLFAKISKTSSSPADAKGTDSLNGKDTSPTGKQGPTPDLKQTSQVLEKVNSHRSSKITNFNEQQIEEAISHDTQEPEDDVPLIAWKAVKKKGQ